MKMSDYLTPTTAAVRMAGKNSPLLIDKGTALHFAPDGQAYFIAAQAGRLR
jgi:hypothetical protein